MSLDRNERNVWVFPAMFCGERYINDPRYLLFDKGEVFFKTYRARRANEKCEMTGDTISPEKCSEFTPMSITYTRNINRGDAIFAGYGADYYLKW